MTKESRKELASIIEELATNKSLCKKDIAIRVELAYELGSRDGMTKMQEISNETLKVVQEGYRLAAGMRV